MSVSIEPGIDKAFAWPMKVKEEEIVATAWTHIYKEQSTSKLYVDITNFPGESETKSGVIIIIVLFILIKTMCVKFTTKIWLNKQ